MRAAREIRRWISKMRKRYGKKNGVIPVGILDNHLMERKAATSHKKRNH